MPHVRRGAQSRRSGFAVRPVVQRAGKGGDMTVVRGAARIAFLTLPGDSGCVRECPAVLGHPGRIRGRGGRGSHVGSKHPARRSRMRQEARSWVGGRSTRQDDPSVRMRRGLSSLSSPCGRNTIIGRANTASSVSAGAGTACRRRRVACCRLASWIPRESEPLGPSREQRPKGRIQDGMSSAVMTGSRSCVWLSFVSRGVPEFAWGSTL